VVRGCVELPIGLGRHRTVTLVDNPRWAEGQATSLGAALRAAETLDAEAVVVGLGDQPFVPPEAWEAVACTSAASPLAVAVYGGVRANPVRLHRTLWSEVPTEGDEGARSLLRRHAESVAEVACTGNPADIDTMEDLLRWS
jgi:molybdenum cofactor cytidylyltransferase